jgi:hypothetical protein
VRPVKAATTSPWAAPAEAEPEPRASTPEPAPPGEDTTSEGGPPEGPTTEVASSESASAGPATTAPATGVEGADPSAGTEPADTEATETFIRPAQAWFGSNSESPARTPPVVRPQNRHTSAVVTVPGVEDSPHPDADETDTFVVRAADRRASAATRAEPAPPVGEAAHVGAAPERRTNVWGDLGLVAPAEPAAPAAPAEPAYVPVPGGYEQRITALAAVPVSPWRRALFSLTGGRLNLG